ncbi:MAG: hypothetical protein ACNA8W_17255, partial [Bradymonadaceae bacterium]
LAEINRELGSGIETVLLPATRNMVEISSSAVRERLREGLLADSLVHPRTVAWLKPQSLIALDT